MSDKAVFKATYSDLRFIKSRKVATVSLELPIEQADAFVKAFGTPNPASETWVGIARLDLSKAAPEAPKAKERRQFADMPLSQQCAIRCNEPKFRRFLARDVADFEMFDVTMAAEEIRSLCKIVSRSELDSNADAAAIWRRIDDAYWGWSRGLA